MKVKINLDDVYMSDVELLEMLELSLNLDYDRSYVQNGVVYRRISNNSDECTGIKTALPEQVYSAYVTIRKYLLNEENNHAE